MSLRGVDIASYQYRMNCGDSEGDFFIVKATQGISYTNPYFSMHYSQAVSAGKLVGAYHYASGGDPVKEADFFLGVVGSRVGNCVLALDWEHNAGGGENPVFNTSKEVEWCRKFAERVHAKTGVWPLFYTSASVTRRRDWSPVAKNCPLWLAQYGSTAITGYQTQPWTDGRQLGAWGRNIAIHQYSPSGSISGYKCNKTHGLDLDIAYMDRAGWKKLASGDKVPQEIPCADKTDTELAIEVWAGLHGGEAQRRKDFGIRYDSIQDEVNRLNDLHISALLPILLDYQAKHGELKKSEK